jgi:Arc/MetJ-type ribon-helix-helix transcriptional regulator
MRKKVTLMANTQPRRARPSSPVKKGKAPQYETPWKEGDPDKRIGINVPFPEPLMLQLDFLVSNRAISSKSSFIRDVVAEAATREVDKLRRVQEAMRRIEAEDRVRK